MQVEAIYNRGNLEFVRPLRLKHDHIRLVVEIPDDELLSEGGAKTETLSVQVDAVLAPYQGQLAQAPSIPQESYKAAWHSHLEEKQLIAHEKSDI